MSRVFVHGLGAVSPAGWGVPALSETLMNQIPLPVQNLARPGWEKPLCVRPVPPPAARPAYLAHPRLRRAGIMSQHTVAAALEALGDDATRVQAGELSLGVIVCMMAGGVTYSRRFYEEVLREPATASPLVFPETVFNAPASHLSAYLNSSAINYTLLGDEGTFLQGIALAADWLERDQADACVVVGVEELDWIVADALRLFQRGTVYSGGAGAIYLKSSATNTIELAAITDPFLFTQNQNRPAAAAKMRAQLTQTTAHELVCGSELTPGDIGAGKYLVPKAVLGEAFVAGAAWQCVVAGDWIRQGKFAAANVNTIGTNEQAVGARFVKSPI